MAARQRDDAKHNGAISGDQLESYLRVVDKADDELIDLKVEHMKACKHPRSRIRSTMKEARESGVNMEALRALIAKHRAERKVAQRMSELESDDRADFEQMLEALGAFGETELGKAALAKAKPTDEKLDTLRT